MIGRYSTISSRDEKRYVNVMMIFMAVGDLLDDIRRFLLDKNAEKYNFVGVDSSFQFYINKKGSNLVLIDKAGKEVDKVNSEELVHAVWQGVNEFLSDYQHYLGPEEIVYGDLKLSTKEFKEAFSLDS